MAATTACRSARSSSRPIVAVRGAGRLLRRRRGAVELLAEGAQPHDECRKLVGHVFREREALFTFLLHDGVDATNWRAEQAIRPAVVSRKVWGGNRTWRGAETQGRMMSLMRTGAQQGVDADEFLARLARAPTPPEVPKLFA